MQQASVFQALLLTRANILAYQIIYFPYIDNLECFIAKAPSLALAAHQSTFD